MGNYYKKRNSKCTKKRRGLIAIVVSLLIMVSAYFYMSFCINPVIKTVSEETIKALTTEAVNSAAAVIMSSNPAYVDLIEVSKTTDGKISLIQANPVLINMLARNTTTQAQKNIGVIGEQGIKIPIGSLTGLAFMAGRGPEVNIKVLPVGSIKTEFESKFTSAGINQTKHRVYMSVIANVSVIVPGMNNVVQTLTQIVISESIIIGEVPNFYMQSNKLDDLFNFVP